MSANLPLPEMSLEEREVSSHRSALGRPPNDELQELPDELQASPPPGADVCGDRLDN